MNRPVPVWLRNVTALITAAVVGVALGITIAPNPPPTIIAYCATDGTLGLHPCPPDDDRWVQAWWPSAQGVARWTGRAWEFQQPILGRHTTTHPPVAWTELP